MLLMPQNLFPVQIENQLTCHRGIREAAAVAVPDRRYGEVVGVFIVREARERGMDMEPGAGRSSINGPKTDCGQMRSWVAEGMNPQVCFFHKVP